MPDAESTHGCAHHCCACTIPRSERYCSAHCREVAERRGAAEALGMSVCRCNHADCIAASVAERDR
ncbi:MAG: hypothetical protein AB7O97_04375 [Planctomycetota bacterium]